MTQAHGCEVNSVTTWVLTLLSSSSSLPLLLWRALTYVPSQWLPALDTSYKCKHTPVAMSALFPLASVCFHVAACISFLSFHAEQQSCVWMVFVLFRPPMHKYVCCFHLKHVCLSTFPPWAVPQFGLSAILCSFAALGCTVCHACLCVPGRLSQSSPALLLPCPVVWICYAATIHTPCAPPILSWVTCV